MTKEKRREAENRPTTIMRGSCACKSALIGAESAQLVTKGLRQGWPMVNTSEKLAITSVLVKNTITFAWQLGSCIGRSTSAPNQPYEYTNLSTVWYLYDAAPEFTRPTTIVCEFWCMRTRMCLCVMYVPYTVLVLRCIWRSTSSTTCILRPT